MELSKDRIETAIHIVEPKRRWGPLKWGERIGEPVVLGENVYSTSIALRELGRDISLHTAIPYTQRLLATINRADPDTIHLGVSVSEFTFRELRAVRGFHIDRDPLLGKRFRYEPSHSNLTQQIIEAFGFTSRVER